MILRLARFAVAAFVLAGAIPVASALTSAPYGVEILVDGLPLEEYAARGATYVLALEGREYSIRLTNRSAERIAVALAVDGLNTIDAKTTTASGASKWILAPHESVTLDGWQTGPASARHFFFTTEEQSYGAWLGRTNNLGIVSAAVFRERRPVPVTVQPLAGESRSRSDKRAPAAAPAPEASDDLAATGIGRELDHRVRRVDFDAEPTPAALLELRYEYEDALVRLGVLPERRSCLDEPLARRERAHGFEGFDFAPDPYRER